MNQNDIVLDIFGWDKNRLNGEYDLGKQKDEKMRLFFYFLFYVFTQEERNGVDGF